MRESSNQNGAHFIETAVDAFGAVVRSDHKGQSPVNESRFCGLNWFLILEEL
jgi:hypothetical protein